MILLTEHWNNKNNKENEQKPKQSCQLQKDTKQKTTTHTTTGGKRLPMYGIQSETTIDSCLWLRTTPGQTHRNRKHRTHNIECPPQLTPWPNQNRDIKWSLRSGRDIRFIIWIYDFAAVPASDHAAELPPEQDLWQILLLEWLELRTLSTTTARERESFYRMGLSYHTIHSSNS